LANICFLFSPTLERVLWGPHNQIALAPPSAFPPWAACFAEFGRKKYILGSASDISTSIQAAREDCKYCSLCEGGLWPAWVRSQQSKAPEPAETHTASRSPNHASLPPKPTPLLLSHSPLTPTPPSTTPTPSPISAISKARTAGNHGFMLISHTSNTPALKVTASLMFDGSE
jgi:hypothetical protein